MYTLKLRRDSARRWGVINPVLADGEPGVETETGRFKIGNGSAKWQELDYFLPGNVADTPNDTLTAHVYADAPHPVYDDGPSLALLYENAKV